MTTIMHLHPLTARALLEHGQRNTERLRSHRETVALARSGGWPESHIRALIQAADEMSEADAMILHNRALSDAVNNEGCGGSCQQGRYPCDCELVGNSDRLAGERRVSDWLADRPLLCAVVALAVVAVSALASAIWPHHWWGV